MSTKLSQEGEETEVGLVLVSPQVLVGVICMGLNGQLLGIPLPKDTIASVPS